MNEQAPMEITSFIADDRGRRFWVVGAHLTGSVLADKVNELVLAARAVGHPTHFDRTITAAQAENRYHPWVRVITDPETGETSYELQVMESEDTSEIGRFFTEADPDTVPVTIYEE